MKINTLELYQYQLPLDKCLPVGKQRIDSRKGVILSLEVLDEAMTPHIEQVEISPLSGLDVEGNPIHGFSQESLEQIIDELESALWIQAMAV